MSNPFNSDPMNLAGPTQANPYVQPDVRNPTAAVASPNAGWDVLALNLTGPPSHYVQPGIGNGFAF